jgi:hypothetical protein
MTPVRMQEIFSAGTIPNLEGLGNVVPRGYTYSNKKITAGKLLTLPGACLKWYNLYPPENIITEKQVLEARTFLELEANAGRLSFENELGFAILHRAGEYLLLLLTTWRYTNEMWESIFLKKADRTENYTPLKFSNDHKGTYCVWELGIVWHERNAWIRFLESKRDEEAKRAYLNDSLSGVV